MLRINLLPAYIAERRKTRVAIAGFSVLFAAVTAIMLFWFIAFQSQVKQREAEANDEQAKADAVTAIKGQATSIRSQLQPIVDKRNFVDQVLFYNTLRGRIYRNVARYTTKDIEYSSMAISGQTLTINAFAKTVPDIGRFLLTIMGNPDFSAVGVSGLPGWPPGGATAAPGGSPGGGGGGYPSGGPSPYPSPAGGMMPASPGGGGYPAPGFGSGPTGGAQTPANVPPPTRKGFPFVVTAQLIKPLAPPSPPGAAAPAGAPGGAPPGARPGSSPGSGGRSSGASSD